MIALLLAAALTASLDTEARAGRPALASPSVRELELNGLLGLEGKTPEGLFGAAYSPRLIVSDAGRLDTLHRGRAAARFRLSPTLLLSFEEQALYGRQDLSPFGAASQITAAPVRFATVVGTTSSVALSDAISRRLNWTAAASYFWGGAVDRSVRGFVPQQRQPAIVTGLGYQLTRTDRLTLDGEGRLAHSDNGSSSGLANVNAGLDHAFSREVRGAITLGAGYNQSQLSPLVPRVWGLLPTASASLRADPAIRGERLSLGVRTLVAPTLDPLTGTAYTRAEVSGNAAWALPRSLELNLAGSYSHVVQGVLEGSQLTQGEVSLGLPAGDHVKLSIGFRVADVRPKGQGSLLAGTQYLGLVQAHWLTTDKF